MISWKLKIENINYGIKQIITWFPLPVSVKFTPGSLICFQWHDFRCSLVFKLIVQLRIFVAMKTYLEPLYVQKTRKGAF